ncbi:MAG: dipeptidase [Pirellulaceae bacterium]|nr:dipeptidase [Pirellulaceae bacterium]
MFDKLETYLEANKARFEEELIDFLKIASISTDSDFATEVRKGARWVHDQFTQLGLTSEIVETEGHPIVYAESPPVVGAPTVLVYGHYDVQPTDPLEEWESPPFEPVRKNGNIVARGATDDKGQMLTHIKSTEAWIQTIGKLPIQLKFVIEGEEESGSENLRPFLEARKERLAADIAVISDSSQFSATQPAITYGLRGLAYFELLLTGPNRDLHSGTFGGAITNPINTLTKMLAALGDSAGRVQIPGFYDEVLPLSNKERRQFADLAFDEQAFKKQLGVKGLSGEEGYSTLERRWARPTFDINGIWGGYQGKGAKTVLPAKAGAKFSFRLVPNQQGDRIAQRLEQFLKTLLPSGIQMELVNHGHGNSVVVPLENRFMAAAADAIEQGFGKPPVYIREGGSIPVVSDLTEILAIDTLLLGWGRDDDNTHSPNEKFNLADFHKGIKSSLYLWHEIAQKSAASI